MRFEFNSNYVKVGLISVLLIATLFPLILFDLGKTTVVKNVEYNPDSGDTLEDEFFISTDYWQKIHTIKGEYIGKDLSNEFIGKHVVLITFYLFTSEFRSISNPFSLNLGTQDVILTTISVHQLNKDNFGKGSWLNSELKLTSLHNDLSKYELGEYAPKAFQDPNDNDYYFAIVDGTYGINNEINGNQNGHFFVDENASNIMSSSFPVTNLDIYSCSSWLNEYYFSRFVVNDYYSLRAQSKMKINSFFLIKSFNELSEVDMDITIESTWTRNHLWHIWEYEVLKTSINVQFSY
jgi:hypothetical protein